MKIPYYQVNAFTGNGFRGNPAGVCLVDCWPEEEQMQLIAKENNLSETAFVLKEEEFYRIRWFTPAVEVDLCGHATLATAYVILQFIQKSETQVRLMSKSGELKIEKEEAILTLNFPADKINPVTLPEILKDSIQMKPLEVFRGKTDYMLVFDDEQKVKSCRPDMELLKTSDCRGVIITAKGNDVDFVSRFFAPQSGIPEDPVTGSAHTTLVPYWSERLDKIKLSAHQLSSRGGELFCCNYGERIGISGNCNIYIEGYIHI